MKVVLQKDKELQINPYDPCPCGSGKKFKFCCFGKINDVAITSDVRPKDQIVHEIIKSNRFKKCFFPLSETEECGEKSILAHSLQKEKALRNIAINGEVMGFDAKDGLKKIGIGKASTFSCFCDEHDKTMFQPIEDSNFIRADQQIFLYNYRSFIREYQLKFEAMKLDTECFKQNPKLAYNKEFIFFRNLHILDYKDSQKIKKRLDNYYLSKKYDLFNSFIYQIPFNCGFAVSSSFAIGYDLEKNAINKIYSMENSEEMHNVYLTVFSETELTYIILSYEKNVAPCYNSFFEQLNKYEKIDLFNIISKLVVIYCDNFYLSPLHEVINNQTKRDNLIYDFHKYLRLPIEINENSLVSDLGKYNFFERYLCEKSV